MDFIFLMLCSLCVVVISAIITIVFRQYVIRRKLRNIPQVESQFPSIAISLLMRMTDFGKKFYKILPTILSILRALLITIKYFYFLSVLSALI
jgi:hypothetical protein